MSDKSPAPQDFDPYYKWLGICPDEQPPNLYQLLGITPFEADLEVISNAADRQAAHIRTFRLGKHMDLCEQLLNEISAARVCLLNAARKEEYDMQLRTAETSTIRTTGAAISDDSPQGVYNPTPAAQPLMDPTTIWVGPTRPKQTPRPRRRGSKRALTQFRLFRYGGLIGAFAGVLVLLLLAPRLSLRDRQTHKSKSGPPRLIEQRSDSQKDPVKQRDVAAEGPRKTMPDQADG